MGFRNLALISAVAVLAVPSAGAFAQVIAPSLSGTYALNYAEICQGYLDGSTGGSVTVETVAATFDPDKKTVTLKGTKTSGDLVVPKMIVGGTFFTNPVSKTYTFSKTATKLSINKVAFNVVYGPSFQQIYQSFMFSGASSAGCAVTATATIQ